MKTADKTLLIHNGTIIDGTGASPVRDGMVLVEAGRLTYVGSATGLPQVPASVERLDAKGGTIMPGLVEAHFHATYFNIAALEDLDIKYPVEYVSLLSSVNSRLALECGYTAARSGGCLFNVDFWLKKAIEEDLIPGPRLSASGREICSAGGLMDWNSGRSEWKDWYSSSMAKRMLAKRFGRW
jgi:imidazolonepropionase-like amidohydrolase